MIPMSSMPPKKVVAEDPDVEGAAVDNVGGAAEDSVGGAAEENVEDAAVEDALADDPDADDVGDVDEAVCDDRSPKSEVGQSWQSDWLHPSRFNANVFFNFSRRDLLLRMLSLGTDIGNVPSSSTFDGSNSMSSGSIGRSESEPIASESITSE